MYDISKKKIRGQRRKLNTLLKRIDNFEMQYPCVYGYDHLHVPCSNDFICSPKVGSFVKKAFCKAWLEKTQIFIQQKPKEAEFCKVVCVLDIRYLWYSQIIIFYDETYYKNFWNRNDEYQKWITIEDRSFKKEKLLNTDMMELGFKEIIVDEGANYMTELWFFGELDIDRLKEEHFVNKRI